MFWRKNLLRLLLCQHVRSLTSFLRATHWGVSPACFNKGCWRINPRHMFSMENTLHSVRSLRACNFFLKIFFSSHPSLQLIITCLMSFHVVLWLSQCPDVWAILSFHQRFWKSGCGRNLDHTVHKRSKHYFWRSHLQLLLWEFRIKIKLTFANAETRIFTYIVTYGLKQK